MRVCVTGVSGFVGGHLAKRLRSEGHHVVGADWKVPDVTDGMLSTDETCDEFLLVDLRKFENCLAATSGCQWVFHLAADMGGMGFISANHAACIVNNSLIDLHVLEACRVNGTNRVFYASSACVYPQDLQRDERAVGLRESDAWPADPQDAYGLEKLFAEEAFGRYAHEFGMDVRIARFHNVYGPHGTWRGGREKSPAALCRKVAASDRELEIWGDGRQTRSYVFVDDLIEGVMRLMRCGDRRVAGGAALNIGTEELISIDDLADLIADIAGKTLAKRHVPGPEGVRGRNSDNDLMRDVLGWEPSTTLRRGMETTYAWISRMVNACEDRADFTTSVISRPETVPLS